MFGRRKVAALLAEFLGTGVLTLVFLGVLRSAIGAPYFVGIAAGLVMTMVLFIFSDASGAHVNPAITIALWTARKVGTLTALLYVIVQLLGAWAAYGLYHYFVNSPLQTIGGQYSFRVLLVEAIGTFVLALGWAAVAFRNYTAGTRAATVGVSYALGIIVAGLTATSFGVINPAVAEGIRAWNVFGAMGWWTYAVGPILGAVIGVNLYGLLFATNNVIAESVVVEEVVVAEAVEAPAATTRRRTTTAKTGTTRRTAATRGRAASTTTRSTRGRTASTARATRSGGTTRRTSTRNRAA